MVLFYHLANSSAADTATTLLSRALKAGWRVMVRGTDDAALARLDDRLWTHPAEGFLPHDRAGGPDDQTQPVLLGTGPVPAGMQGLLLVDGAEVSPDEVPRLERVWVLFDGADPEALIRARVQWKAIVAAGLPAQYWSEEGGGWERKHEVAGSDRKAPQP